MAEYKIAFKIQIGQTNFSKQNKDGNKSLGDYKYGRETRELIIKVEENILCGNGDFGCKGLYQSFQMDSYKDNFRGQQCQFKCRTNLGCLRRLFRVTILEDEV
ncbi:Hypothetical_protein [Hexamita inflata]|uniref:Hypothetical_protein n=1 Tax=Hexamita inflata TaxID=28002 RepID=A0ABP1HPG2_9EUKA